MGKVLLPSLPFIRKSLSGNLQPGAAIAGGLLSISLSLTPQQELGLCEKFAPLL